VFSALSRRQLGAIPLAALLAAALLLVGSANAPAAKTSKAPCASKSSIKAERNAHRDACPARKHKGHAKAKRHHTKHTLKTKRHTTTATNTAAALCDNGSEPQSAGNGTFSCADGSEPGCEDGLEATPSASGSQLNCVAPSDSESANQACEEEDGQPCWEEGSEQGPEGVEGSTEGG
jgi:hypothetical protein